MLRRSRLTTPEKLSKEEAELKEQIQRSLKNQGFGINPHLRLPEESRQVYKQIQLNAKGIQMKSHKKFILGFMDKAAKFCVDGRDIDPASIRLELREVRSRTFEEKLFLWWNLVWWSMPYQHAYGRQMRFFLWDVHHDTPFGLLYLQSPVLHMRARDKFLMIPRDRLDYWVNMSMSAQRVGAVPPYNDLIGGKMAAMALTSNEIKGCYERKYDGRTTLMRGRVVPSNLLFVTTTSAFGKSSMYDRLVYRDQLVGMPIGYTDGIGTFHLSDVVTAGIYSMLRRRGVDTRTTFGYGPSSKVRLIKRGLNILGLKGFYRHGIRRQVYLFPLIKNLNEMICRDDVKAVPLNRPFGDLVSFWKARWAVPRSRRVPRWRGFDSRKFLHDTASMLDQNE